MFYKHSGWVYFLSIIQFALLVFTSIAVISNNVYAQTCDPPAFIDWTDAELDSTDGNLTTTLAGKTVSISSTVTANPGPGSTSFRGDTWGYSGSVTADGGPAGTGDVQLSLRQSSNNAGATTIVEFGINPHEFGDLNLFISDAEYTDFVVYAEDADGNRLATTAWNVTSYEQNGTSPASLPNPFTINATDISFDSVLPTINNPQNDDAMRIRFDLTTLASAVKIVVETTSFNTLLNEGDNLEFMLTTNCPLLASIRGTIYNDLDGNAVQDGSDTGLGDITVTLTDSSSNVFTTTTLPDGSYAFLDLPADDYTVTVDTTTLPGAMSPTPPTQTEDPDDTGVCTVCDSITTTPPTLIAGQAITDIDFGYTGHTLPVTLSHFSSERSGNRVDIDWSTSSELFNTGFQLWGLDGTDGGWTKLHNRLIKSGSGNAVEPQSYSKRVRVPKSIDQLVALGISSVDSDGSEHYYGPFEIGVAYGDLTQLEPIEWNDIRAQVDAQMHSNGYLKDQGGYRKADLSADSTASGLTATDLLVEFSVPADGMYRITAAALATGGMDLSDVAKSQIALLDHQGNAVVRYVLAKGKGRGPNKTLGTNGEIYFYGQAPDESAGLYTDASVYRLVLDSAKAHNALTQAKQGLKEGFSDQYIEHSEVENDAIYVLTSAADDPWVSGVVVGYADRPSLYGVQVPVEADALWDQPSTLTLGLGRSSQLPSVDADGDGVQDVEHIVEGLGLDLNNELVRFGQRTATGAGVWDLAFEIPSDTPLALNEGHALLGGGFSAGAGYAFSEVHVDRIGLAYARPTMAKAGEDHLAFSGSNGGEPGYAVTLPNNGTAVVFASDGANLVRITPESQQRIKNAQGDKQRVVKFAALQGAGLSTTPVQYWVSAKDEYLPVVDLSARTIPTPDSVLTQAQGSDYLMIVHPAFMGSDSSGVDQLSSYATFKQSQGYGVSTINYLDIVDAFGGGQAGPKALSRYLDAVYRTDGQLQHVLLVGGSTYDHTDNLNTGAITFIPGHYGPSSYSNYTLSDVPYIQDNEGTLFANIGRWPVRTMGDVAHIVDKSMRWGQADHTQVEALLIAENTLAGENINFAGALDGVASVLPTHWQTNKVYVDEILASNPGLTQAQAFAQAKGEIIAHLNAVPEVVLFNGHADTRQLSNNGLFKSSHIAQVTAPGAEVWIPMSCYVTFYESTHVNTLAHQLLFTGNAVNITGSMLLSDQSGNIAMGQSILGGVFNQGQTLGAAVNQGKTQMNNPQLDINWALLGDPTVSF